MTNSPPPASLSPQLFGPQNLLEWERGFRLSMAQSRLTHHIWGTAIRPDPAVDPNAAYCFDFNRGTALLHLTWSIEPVIPQLVASGRWQEVHADPALLFAAVLETIIPDTTTDLFNRLVNLKVDGDGGYPPRHYLAVFNSLARKLEELRVPVLPVFKVVLVSRALCPRYAAEELHRTHETNGFTTWELVKTMMLTDEGVHWLRTWGPPRPL
ncbi:hypothetical protein F5Y10DRAFT_238946 [Nemania abortiva]|nr:hypothetical protein F5Y10DRAFT_238946 [Nemania abortiva]